MTNGQESLIHNNLSMDRQLIVFATPLQLINAIEYLAMHPAESTCVDLIDISYGVGQRRVIKNILQSSPIPFQETYQLPFDKSNIAIVYLLQSLANRVAYALSRSRPLSDYETIIIGHYAQPIFRYFFSPSARNIVAVDDGMFTLNCPAGRERELIQNKPFEIRGALHHRFNHFLWRSQGIPASVTWFTRYDIRFPGSDTVILNHLNYLKSLTNSKENSNTLMFIGMSLVESGILSLEHYLSKIANLASKYSHLEFQYVAKYSESPEVLTGVKKLVNEFGGTMVFPDANLEIFLANSKYLPATIASFYTSALINAMDILGEKTEYVCIDLAADNLVARQSAIIEECYATIKRHPVFMKRGHLVV